jgi:hypothetical protein
MTAAAAFLRDLRDDARFPRDVVDNLAAAFKAMEAEGYEVDDAATYLQALEWILAKDNLTVDQKLLHIGRLSALGKVENLNLEEFISLQ